MHPDNTVIRGQVKTVRQEGAFRGYVRKCVKRVSHEGVFRKDDGLLS